LKKEIIVLAIAALISVVAFLFLYPHQILNPQNTDWLVSGDRAQHFLGYLFFFKEPLSWPLGKINSFMYPFGSSLCYTDSIPLLGILFKILKVSGEQYFGFWLLLNFATIGT
jgi:Family of unknown function (DUF6311)